MYRSLSWWDDLFNITLNHEAVTPHYSFTQPSVPNKGGGGEQLVEG